MPYSARELVQAWHWITVAERDAMLEWSQYDTIDAAKEHLAESRKAQLRECLTDAQADVEDVTLLRLMGIPVCLSTHYVDKNNKAVTLFVGVDNDEGVPYWRVAEDLCAHSPKSRVLQDKLVRYAAALGLEIKDKAKNRRVEQ